MKHKTIVKEKRKNAFLRKQGCRFGCSLFFLLASYIMAIAQPNQPPLITSDNVEGFTENSFDIVMDVFTTDDTDTETGGGLTYSFTGGPLSLDQSLFELQTATGIITFLSPPDYENPADYDSNNLYEISIQVCDSENLCDTLEAIIMVQDSPENFDVECEESAYDFLTIEPSLNAAFASSLYRTNIYTNAHEKVLDTEIPIRNLSYSKNSNQFYVIGDSAQYAGKLYSLTNGTPSEFNEIVDLAELNPSLVGKQGYSSATYRNDSLYFFMDDKELHNKLFAIPFNDQGVPTSVIEVAEIPGLDIPIQNAIGSHADIAFSKLGIMYGIDWYVNADNINSANQRVQRFWKYNISTGVFTMIKESTRFYNHEFVNSYASQEKLDFFGIGISADATLFGIDLLGDLYSININNGLTTPYLDYYTVGIPAFDGDFSKFNCDLFSSNVCEGDSTSGDDDNDFICNDIDNCPAVANPDQADCDGDGIGDVCEIDDDGDGIPNDCDLCLGDNATGDADGDGICDDIDNCNTSTNPDQADCDGDGIGDDCEDDDDGDGIPNDCDLCLGDNATGDADGDGICDDIDNCDTSTNPDQGDCDGDGIGDDCEIDDDGDGIPNDCDLCLGDNATGDADGDGICDDIDNCDTSTNPDQGDCDGDGIGDDCEIDDDGDGIPNDCDTCVGDDTAGDADGDGICDDIDNCVDVPNADQADCDEDGIADVCEDDDDGDGVPNDCDTCVGDDTAGDADGDGICDDIDNCVDVPNADQADCDEDGIADVCEDDDDGDGVPNDCDTCVGDDTAGDADGDGICDDIDNCVDVPNADQADCDEDGIADVCEDDDDGDGVPNDCDTCVGDDTAGDADGDGICDDIDNCIDVPNADQADCDEDGIADVCEDDDDGDGVPNDCDTCVGDDTAGDADGDGICDDIDNCVDVPNADQADCDEDGIADVCEDDDDGDGVPNDCDTCVGDDTAGDADGDGICDDIDNCIDVPNADQADCDEDGIADVCEDDDDGDGVPNDCDTCVGDDTAGDADGDGICDDIDNCVDVPNTDQADCDEDGIADVCEEDDDGDGIPNDCDTCVGDDTAGDADGDGICDDIDNCVDVPNTDQADCDGDGIGDDCEEDDDGDGIPNDCDLCLGDNSTGDADGDGICDDVDNCDSSTNPDQSDCDGDGIGDDCEEDDDGDGIPNDCDLCLGDNSTGDADGDGICDDVDNCDTSTNPDQSDCDGDGIGDDCEEDDDGDGIPNDCDTCIGDDTVGDADDDGICDDIDNCIDIANPDQADCNEDGTGDVCEPDDDNDQIPNGCDFCFGNNGTGDTDSDGICDDVDNCDDIFNPDQADCDEDGIGDACESDSDNDGIPDDCDTVVGCNNYSASADLIGGGCVGVGEFAQLQVTIDAGDSNPAIYSFSWTGPNNYFSTAQSPIINNITENDAGDYTVVITNLVDSCITTLTVTLPVSIEPEQPFVATSNEVVCIGGDLVVYVTSNNDMPLPQFDHYEWTGPLGSTSSGAYPNESAIIINDYEIGYDGVYQVVVTYNGCPSIVSEPLGVFAADLVNAPAVESNINLCQGEVLTLQTSTFAEEYYWTGPNGFSSTDQNPIVSNSVNTLFEGEYTLVVVNAGCESPGSLITVTVAQTPATPGLEVVPAICGGDEIVLTTAFVPGATYQWISPSNLPTGFFGAAPTPDNVIWTTEATTTISASLNPTWYETGAWRVQTVTAENCVSAPSLPVMVEILEVPSAPIATSMGDVCEGQAIQLLATEIPGAGYLWYDGDPAASPPANLIATLKDPIVTGFPVGTYTFYVQTVLGPCSSTNYGQVEVMVTEQPVLSGVTNTGPYCQNSTIELQAPEIPGGLYYWEGPNNFISGLQNPIIENAQISNSGIYTLYVSVDGCNSIVVSTNVLVGVDQVGVPIATGNSLVCEGEDILLSVSNPILGATYEWFDSLGNVFLGIGEELLIENASAADAGTYYVVATLGACVSDPSMTTPAGEDAFIQVSVQGFSTNVAWFGDPVYSCEDTVTVTALPLNGGEGEWTWADPTSTALIHYPDLEKTFVSGLLEGDNYLVWTIYSGVCGFTSSDTLLIEWAGQEPRVVGENYEVPFDGELTNIDLSDNDTPYTQAFDFIILSYPENGTLRPQNNGLWTYEPNQGFAGEDQIEYQICQQYCPDNCGEAVATFNVGVDITCVAPTVITPNGDGLNDEFIVPCVYNSPGSSLSVFNRWGAEIYFSENYQNDWGGTFDEGDLPSGTYFYIIELKDGNGTRLSGHVFIER